jgi:peptidoglycan/xylan/chitin deacetylase (PgdA/CDA1 family)
VRGEVCKHVLEAGFGLAGREVGNFLTFPDDDHAVAHGLDLREDVCRQQDGLVTGKAADQLSKLPDLIGVETRRGLVENEDWRIGDEGFREPYPLTVTLRELSDNSTLRVGHAGELERAVDGLVDPFDVLEGAAVTKIFNDTHLSIERHAFGHVTEPRPRLHGARDCVDAVDANLARRRCQVAGQHAERRRLPCAVRTEEACDLPPLHAERDLVHRDSAAVASGQPLNFDHASPIWPTEVTDAIARCNWRPVQVLRLSRFGRIRFLTIAWIMPWISWRLRVVCCALAIVAGGSFMHASEIVSDTPPKAFAAMRPAPAPMLEPEHEEPGPAMIRKIAIVSRRDSTGRRFPAGLTLSGGTKRRMILFSFDDGPSKRTTPRLLDLLDELSIKAVFFVTSESFGNGNPWEREHAEIVREIVRRGHTIGNHTETHRQLPLLRNVEIEGELQRSAGKIAWAVGSRPRLIRPPGGALSRRVEQILGEHGYTSVMWAIYPEDLEVHTAEAVVRSFFRVLKRREEDTGDRGGIVLMHDTKPHTLDALPRVVAALKRRNCELLLRGEELYDIVDDLGYFIPDYPADQSLDERQAALAERTQRECDALALLR